MSNLEFLIDIFKKNYIAIIGVLIGIISIIGSSLYVYFSKEDCPICDSVIDEKNEEEDSIVTVPVETLKVDVKGAVKNPGVYELVKGTNIENAIKSAGGITSKGTTSNINLSRKLVDEMVIYVFTKEELDNKESSNEIVCEIPKCECETISINDTIENVNGSSQNGMSTGKLSINTATIEELSTLEGIGESKAKAIVLYREENGPFEKIEDLMKVSGIKEALFEKIKDKITV